MLGPFPAVRTLSGWDGVRGYGWAQLGSGGSATDTRSSFVLFVFGSHIHRCSGLALHSGITPDSAQECWGLNPAVRQVVPYLLYYLLPFSFFLFWNSVDSTDCSHLDGVQLQGSGWGCSASSVQGTTESLGMFLLMAMGPSHTRALMRYIPGGACLAPHRKPLAHSCGRTGLSETGGS